MKIFLYLSSLNNAAQVCFNLLYYSFLEVNYLPGEKIIA